MGKSKKPKQGQERSGLTSKDEKIQRVQSWWDTRELGELLPIVDGVETAEVSAAAEAIKMMLSHVSSGRSLRDAVTSVLGSRSIQSIARDPNLMEKLNSPASGPKNFGYGDLVDNFKLTVKMLKEGRSIKFWKCHDDSTERSTHREFREHIMEDHFETGRYILEKASESAKQGRQQLGEFMLELLRKSKLDEKNFEAMLVSAGQRKPCPLSVLRRVIPPERILYILEELQKKNTYLCLAFTLPLHDYMGVEYTLDERARDASTQVEPSELWNLKPSEADAVLDWLRGRLKALGTALIRNEEDEEPQVALSPDGTNFLLGDAFLAAARRAGGNPCGAIVRKLYSLSQTEDAPCELQRPADAGPEQNGGVSLSEEYDVACEVLSSAMEDVQTYDGMVTGIESILTELTAFDSLNWGVHDWVVKHIKEGGMMPELEDIGMWVRLESLLHIAMTHTDLALWNILSDKYRTLRLQHKRAERQVASVSDLSAAMEGEGVGRHSRGKVAEFLLGMRELELEASRELASCEAAIDLYETQRNTSNDRSDLITDMRNAADNAELDSLETKLRDYIANNMMLGNGDAAREIRRCCQKLQTSVLPKCLAVVASHSIAVDCLMEHLSQLACHDPWAPLQVGVVTPLLVARLEREAERHGREAADRAMAELLEAEAAAEAQAKAKAEKAQKAKAGKRQRGKQQKPAVPADPEPSAPTEAPPSADPSNSRASLPATAAPDLPQVGVANGGAFGTIPLLELVEEPESGEASSARGRLEQAGAVPSQPDMPTGELARRRALQEAAHRRAVAAMARAAAMDAANPGREIDPAIDAALTWAISTESQYPWDSTAAPLGESRPGAYVPHEQAEAADIQAWSDDGAGVGPSAPAAAESGGVQVSAAARSKRHAAEPGASHDDAAGLPLPLLNIMQGGMPSPWEVPSASGALSVEELVQTRVGGSSRPARTPPPPAQQAGTSGTLAGNGAYDFSQLAGGLPGLPQPRAGRPPGKLPPSYRPPALSRGAAAPTDPSPLSSIGPHFGPAASDGFSWPAPPPATIPSSLPKPAPAPTAAASMQAPPKPKQLPKQAPKPQAPKSKAAQARKQAAPQPQAPTRAPAPALPIPQEPPKQASSASSTGSGPRIETKLQEEFTCPITCEQLVDPVIAADGFTYERSAIEQWLARNATSPMTGGALPHKGLVPNLLVKNAMSMLQQPRRR